MILNEFFNNKQFENNSFGNSEPEQQQMDANRRSRLGRERNAGLDEPDDVASEPVQTRNGVYEYTVPAGQEDIAQELGLQQHRGHWVSRVPIQRANFQFGRPQFHEIPAKGVAEANIQPTSAASRSHIGNLSNPVTNSVVHPSSGKEIGLITMQPTGEYYAQPSSTALANSQGGTFATKDEAHQFIRNAHAKAIKNGTLSDKWLKKQPLPQFAKGQSVAEGGYPEVDHMPGKRGIGLDSAKPRDTYVKTFHASKEKEAQEFAKKNGYIVKKHVYPKSANNSQPYEFQVHKNEQGVAEESSENKYSNLSNRGVNRGINRAADDFDRMMDLDQVQSPHYKTQHQQDTKQRLKTKPMAGPKGVLPEQGVAEDQLDEIGNTPAGKAALRAVQNRATDTMDTWSKNSASGYSSTPKQVKKATGAAVSAGNRLHGFGPDRMKQNTVMARDALRKGVAEAATPASVSKVLRLIQHHHSDWFDTYGMGEVEDAVVDMAKMGQFQGMSAEDAVALVAQELDSLYGAQGMAEGPDDDISWMTPQQQQEFRSAWEFSKSHPKIWQQYQHYNKLDLKDEFPNKSDQELTILMNLILHGLDYGDPNRMMGIGRAVRTILQWKQEGQQGVAEARFPGAPDVEMPPMKPSGDPERDKLKQEYMDLHREIKSLVDLQYTSKSAEEKIQAKARIKQLNDRADQIRAILEPRQPPNEWQKKTYGYDDNWNKVNQGMAEGKKPDSYHIVNKDGKPATLASYADKASAVKDRDAKHPGAEVRQVGPRGKVKGVAEAKAKTQKKEVVGFRSESEFKTWKQYAQKEGYEIREAGNLPGSYAAFDDNGKRVGYFYNKFDLPNGYYYVGEIMITSVEQGVAEVFANPGSGSTGTARGAKRIATTVRKALAKHPETPEQIAARKDFEARIDARRAEKREQGVAEGILGSDPNRGQKVPDWAKGGIVGKIGRHLDPAWSDVQRTVPKHLLAKQPGAAATNAPTTKDTPKSTSATPTRAIPKSTGPKPSQPVTKNVVKTIADKQGVAEGEKIGGLYDPVDFDAKLDRMKANHKQNPSDFAALAARLQAAYKNTSSDKKQSSPSSTNESRQARRALMHKILKG